MSKRSTTVIFFMSFLFSVTVPAHQSPSTRIDELSHTMETEGPSPRFLVERGYEYRAIGESRLAELDLKWALHLEPTFCEAHIGLGRLYLRAEEAEKCLRVVGAGLEHAHDTGLVAQLKALEAQAYVLLNNFEQALASINKALASTPLSFNLVLLKSSLLKELGHPEERIQTVREAYTKNGSVALGIELIDALRDGEAYEECLTRINTYLAKRRYKAEWYLRRAEVYRVMNKDEEARADATRALHELQERLDTSRPAAHLYQDMARAYDLLGNATARDAMLEKLSRLAE